MSFVPVYILGCFVNRIIYFVSSEYRIISVFDNIINILLSISIRIYLLECGNVVLFRFCGYKYATKENNKYYTRKAELTKNKNFFALYPVDVY